MNPLAYYGISDAKRFPAFYSEVNAERPDTTFYADFKVAEPYGLKAVRGTYRRIGVKSRDWKEQVELAVVLNHLLWEEYERHPDSPTELYNFYTEKYYGLMAMFNRWTDEQKLEYKFKVLD